MCKLMVICRDSFDKGESNFAWSHLLNLLNSDYAKGISPELKGLAGGPSSLLKQSRAGCRVCQQRADGSLRIIIGILDNCGYLVALIIT